MDLNHLHLAVADAEKSKTFYEKCFGFTEKVRYGKLLFMTNPSGFDLALDPKYTPSALPEWYHHGFRLGGASDVKTTYEKIKSDYPTLIKKELTTIDDHTFFRCTDPDGYSIEVYWEPQT